MSVPLTRAQRILLPSCQFFGLSNSHHLEFCPRRTPRSFAVLTCNSTGDYDTQLTPLFRARDAAVVEMLVRAGADVEAAHCTFRPLHEVGNNVALCRALIRAEASVNSTQLEADTALHSVVAEEVCDELIAAGAVVDARNAKGRTPLHYARDGDIAAALLRRGADVNAVGTDDKTPLHCAQNASIVAQLIARGATVNAVSKTDGATPLHSAMYYSRWDDSDDRVHIVQELLKAGAWINAQDLKGKSPLHLVSECRHREVLDILLLAGADANTRDVGGRTPLHAAWRTEVVSALFAAGADAHALDNDGRSALHSASYDRGVLTALIAAGVDVNGRASDGATPLLDMTRRGYNVTELQRTGAAAPLCPLLRIALSSGPTAPLILIIPVCKLPWLLVYVRRWCTCAGAPLAVAQPFLIAWTST